MKGRRVGVEPGLLLPSAEELFLDNPDKNGLKEEIVRILDSLTNREREVIEMRYGIKDNQLYTLEEVRKKLGITLGRVWQIEAHALSKLRHPTRSYKLKDYLR